MELIAIFATVILLATVLTLVFAFASYFVSRAKRRLKKEKEPGLEDEDASPVRTYFERYYPEGGVDEDRAPPAEPGREQWL